MTAICPFVRIGDEDDVRLFASLQAVLKGRQPKSTNMYNMTLLYPNFRDKTNFYVFEGRSSAAAATATVCPSSSSWIFSVHQRADYGPAICISGPPGEAVPVQLSAALASEDETTRLFDWSSCYEWVSIDHDISDVIIEIAHTKNQKQNVGSSLGSGSKVDVYFCNHYVVDADRMVMNKVDLSSRPGLELRPLTAENGPKLLVDTWPSSKQGSLLQCTDLITKGVNSAVYLNDQPVSWACLHQCGFIGPLYTLEAFRGKGYGKMCMVDFLRKLTFDTDYVPCSMVDHDNDASNSVHLKAGMVVSHFVDFILFGR